ncbi:MAG: hydrogenase 3 maturation endopeptidase HyCI [Candidatus Heimdallarchaeaceae archaeon]
MATNNEIFDEAFVSAIDKFFSSARLLVVLGIGNELNGDDAVGLYVTKRLQSVVPFPEWVKIFYCEKAPEHFLGKLYQLQPDKVLVLDAANMNAPPGSIAIIPKEIIWGGYNFSTHTLSLTLLEEFLGQSSFSSANDFQMMFIGIQPKQMIFDTPLSPECEEAAEELATFLIERIKIIDSKRKSTS